MVPPIARSEGFSASNCGGRFDRLLPEDCMPGLSNTLRFIVVTAAALGLVACGDPDSVTEKRTGASGDRTKRDMATGLGGRNTETGSLFGPGGIFGSKAEKKEIGRAHV